MLGLIALPVAGCTITQSLVSDGLERYTGEERKAAEDALSAARGTQDHPLERGLTPGLQVTEVRLEPGYCPVAGAPQRNYQAVVQTYGLFAMPTGTVVIECGSATRVRS